MTRTTPTLDERITEAVKRYENEDAESITKDIKQAVYTALVEYKQEYEINMHGSYGKYISKRVEAVPLFLLSAVLGIEEEK